MEPLLPGVSTFFSWLMDYTIDVSILICLIFIIKAIAAKKLPAWWHYSLWIILLLRMIVPFRFENFIKTPNFVPITIEERLFESVLIEEESITAKLTAELPSTAQQGWNIQVDDVIVLLWLTFAIIFGIYVLIKNIKFRQDINKEPLLEDKKVLALLEKCKSRMNARTPLKITITNRVKSPALFGYIRPRLLIPAGVLEKLDDAELSYIFMHELGHLKRHDIGVSWIITFLHVFQWFNPFVWLAFYQMRIDQESACDASVLSRIKNNQTIDYASTIVGFLENFCRNRKLTAMIGILENQTQIKKRITKIVNYKKYSKVMMFFSTAMLLFIGFVFFSLAGFGKAKHEAAVMDSSIIQTLPFEVSTGIGVNGSGIVYVEDTAVTEDMPQKNGMNNNKTVPEHNARNLQIEKFIAEVQDNNIKSMDESLILSSAAAYREAVSSQEKANRAQKLQAKKEPVKVQDNNIENTNKTMNSPDAAKNELVVSQKSVEKNNRKQRTQNLQASKMPAAAQGDNVNENTALMSEVAAGKAPAEVLRMFKEVYNISHGEKDVLAKSSRAAYEKDQLAGAVQLSQKKAEAAEEDSMSYLSLAGLSFYGMGNSDFSEKSRDVPEKKSDEEKIYNLKDVDVHPKPVRIFKPRYPYRAQGKGIEGKVLIGFTVDKEGHVQNPKVVNAKPKGVFEKTALDTIVKYKFKPAIKDGKSVSSFANFRISFDLDDVYPRYAQR